MTEIFSYSNVLTTLGLFLTFLRTSLSAYDFRWLRGFVYFSKFEILYYSWLLKWILLTRDLSLTKVIFLILGGPHNITYILRPTHNQPCNWDGTTLSGQKWRDVRRGAAALAVKLKCLLFPSLVWLCRSERDVDGRTDEPTKRGGSGGCVCKDGRRRGGFGGNQGTYFSSFSPIPTERLLRRVHSVRLIQFYMWEVAWIQHPGSFRLLVRDPLNEKYPQRKFY